MYAVIDVGGTKIKIEVYKSFDLVSKVESIQFKTEHFDKDIPKIKRVLEKFIIDEIVFFIPGSVTNDGIIVDAVNLKNWDGIDLKEYIDVNKMYFLHDIAGHAFSEIAFNDRTEDFIFIGWGSGIGASSIRFIDNSIIVDQVEFGHQYIDESGKDLEQLIGGVHLEDRFGIVPENLDPDKWELISHDLSLGISNLIVLRRVKDIIWGGSIGINKFDVVETAVKDANERVGFWQVESSIKSKYGLDSNIIGGLGYLKIVNEGNYDILL